ncbi:unnamed protein product [Calypogeia fissa]
MTDEDFSLRADPKIFQTSPNPQPSLLPPPTVPLSLVPTLPGGALSQSPSESSSSPLVPSSRIPGRTPLHYTRRPRASTPPLPTSTITGVPIPVELYEYLKEQDKVQKKKWALLSSINSSVRGLSTSTFSINGLLNRSIFKATLMRHLEMTMTPKDQLQLFAFF